MATLVQQNTPEVHEQLKRTGANFPLSSKERFPKSEKEVQQLLPGIPDDITLNHISTKLPWRAIDILSTVSSTWRRAIRSRLVYDTRVRYQSLETLLLHSHYGQNGGSGEIELLCLYSPRDDCCYELPGIPGVERGIPYFSDCISLDGKIYVLGGLVQDGLKQSCPEEVFVFDVAGERQWKECARKQPARPEFGCVVFDGKIYVFGRRPQDDRAHSGSEVYDPKTNSWSRIMTMPSRGWPLRFQADAQGEELFVHSGGSSGCGGHYFYDVYHPGKSEWRTERFADQPRLEDGFTYASGRVFRAEGKFYLITHLGIHVRDINNSAWEDLHSYLFAGFGPCLNRSAIVGKVAALVVLNDELFGILSAVIPQTSPLQRPAIIPHLVKWAGFRSKKHAIVCRVINCRSKLENFGYFLHAIQL